jgi:hypothetical protein
MRGLHRLQVWAPWMQSLLGFHTTQSPLRTALPLLSVMYSHIFAPCSMQLLRCVVCPYSFPM